LLIKCGSQHYWISIEDIERFNSALAPLDLFPDRDHQSARQRGRYVLENDEHIDVLVARAVPTVEGIRVAFDDVWSRRIELQYDGDVRIAIPSMDDLILTKQWSMRDRDLADIRLIRALKATQEDDDAP